VKAPTQHPAFRIKALPGGSPPTLTAPPLKEDGDNSAPMAGEPIEGVDVKLGKKSGGSIAVVKTGEGGTFRFTDLPSGMYELTVPASLPNRVSVGGEGTISGMCSAEATAKAAGSEFFASSNVRANSTDVKQAFRSSRSWRPHLLRHRPPSKG